MARKVIHTFPDSSAFIASDDNLIILGTNGVDCVQFHHNGEVKLLVAPPTTDPGQNGAIYADDNNNLKISRG